MTNKRMTSRLGEIFANMTRKQPTTTSMLGELLANQHLAVPLHDALGHLARLEQQRNARIEELERKCASLTERLDAQQTEVAQMSVRTVQAESQSALLGARIEALEAVQQEATHQEEARREQELREKACMDVLLRQHVRFSPTLRAQLVGADSVSSALHDFVLINVETTPFGSLLTDPNRGGDDPSQQIVPVPTVFAIQRAPLTRAQWELVKGVSAYARNEDKHKPVCGQTVWDLLAFCNELSELDGLEPCYELRDPKGGRRSARLKSLHVRGYRLPLEVEWEAAARAGGTDPWYGELDHIAWHAQNSGGVPKPVGQLQPNANGLYDILGNVRELAWWVDLGHDAFETVKVFSHHNCGPIGRGGSYLHEPTACQFNSRSLLSLINSSPDLGVRLVRTVEVRDSVRA